MKFDLGAVISQLISLYARLPLAQKIGIPILIAGSVAVIIFVSRWGGRPDYALLYANLSEADAAAVVERLKERKVSFQLRNEGKTVDIAPASLVHEVRLELASANLPRGGGVGYEIFNESALGRTGFVEDVFFIRALQGELERTIQAIDAVQTVRVHITKPKRSVFVKRDELPTASVLVRLKAGMELDAGQVRGIVNLVANGVERMTPENVSVIDSRGRLLNEKAEGPENELADATRLQFQKSLENSMSKRIEAMLSEILGPGRAVATVNASLDFARFEKEEESYDPGGVVTRSERSVEESAGLGAEGGVPGVISNLTNSPELLKAPDSSKSGNLRKEQIKNFEVSRAVSRTVSSPGQIVRLSVAVLVDGKHGAPAEGSEEKVYEPLPAETMEKIEKLVKQTVGFDAARGDIVTVENIQFFEPDAALEELLAADASMDSVWKGVIWAGPVVVALLFFLMVVRPLVKFLTAPTGASVDLTRLLPQGVEELRGELESERTRAPGLPGGMSSTDIEELEELLAENSRFVKENPEKAAMLIRYWLNEGRA